jgi:type VI protein secretion system component Hcp
MKIRSRTLQGLAVASAFALLPEFGPGQAAFDAFLRFTDPEGGAKPVAGDSVDKNFRAADGWFEISSFDHGILNTVNVGLPAGGTGKAKFEDFNFSKLVNAGSPALFGAVAGGFYQRANLSLRQAGFNAPNAPFYEATFDTVFIKSVRWSGAAGDDAVQEDVSTVFGAMEWSYTSFDADGKPRKAVTVNWSQITNSGGDGGLEGQPPSVPTLSYAGAKSVASGGALTVNPSSGPSDPTGIASVTVQSVGGYTGNISVNNSGVVQISNASPVGGPYSITIRAASNGGGVKDASFNLTVNAVIPALIANADSLTRALSRSVKIPVAMLVGNDSNGAVFDALPSATTALGGRVALSGTTIIYDPPVPDPGTDDSFTYRIRDSFSQTSTGTVTVTVGGPNGGPSGNLIIGVSDEGRSLRLVGIPGRKYQLQAAGDVNGPWSNFGDAVTADANGSADWLDSSPDSPRFYRAYNVP